MPTVWGLIYGGYVYSNPAPVKSGLDSLAVVALNYNSTVMRSMWGNAGWTAWTPWQCEVDTLALGDPVAPRVGDGQFDVVARNTDHDVAHWYYDASTGDEGCEIVPAGDPTVTPPSVVRQAHGVLDVFAIGDQRTLRHVTRTDAWSAWEDLGTASTSPSGGALLSGPAAVSGAPGTLDVFAVGVDNTLRHWAWRRAGWTTGAAGVTGAVLGRPAATAAMVGMGLYLHVFALGLDGAMQHAWMDTTTWHGFESLGGSFQGTPYAVSFDQYQAHVFALSSNGLLMYGVCDGRMTPQFSGWRSLGGPFVASPSALWFDGAIHVFAVDPQSNACHTTIPLSPGVG